MAVVGGVRGGGVLPSGHCVALLWLDGGRGGAGGDPSSRTQSITANDCWLKAPKGGGGALEGRYLLPPPDSTRPQPLWRPPPTACLTASEALSLLMRPWAGVGVLLQFTNHPSSVRMFMTVSRPKCCVTGPTDSNTVHCQLLLSRPRLRSGHSSTTRSSPPPPPV